MKLKKYAFSLMEVLVACVILSLILSVIFSSIYRETLLKTRIEKMEKIVMPRVEIQQCLDRIFASVVSTDAPRDESPLYSIEGPNPTLIVTFDNGVEPDPLFSGVLQGLLLVEEGALLLKLHPGKEYERVQLLKEKVDSLTFEFLNWEEIGVQTTTRWDKKRPAPPHFIKIVLNEEEAYVFWINQSPKEAIVLRKSA